MKYVSIILVIVILLIGNLAFITPFVANSMRDFSSLEGWEQTTDGETEYGPFYHGDEGTSHLIQLYELIGSPIRLTLVQLLLLSISCGLVFCIYSINTFRRPYDWFRKTVLPIQLLCVAILVTAPFIGNAIFRICTKLEPFPSAVNNYQFAQLVFGIVTPVILILIVDFVLFWASATILALVDKINELRVKLITWLLAKINIVPGEELLTIDHRSDVKLQTVTLDGLLPRATVVGQTRLSALFGYMLGDRNSVFDDIKARLNDACAEELSTTGVAALQRVSTSMMTALHTSADNFIKMWTQHYKKQPELAPLKTATGIVQSISDTTLSRYRAEVSGMIKSTLSEHLQRVYTELGPTIQGVTQSAQASQANVLLPHGTRYFVRSGEDSAFVIEQRPQVRTVRFDDTFAEYVKENGDPIDSQREFRLSFPYVVFAVGFWDLEQVSLSVFCDVKPLDSLDSQISLLGLPNIHPDGSVCLGRGFRDIVGNPIKRVENLLDYFWSSIFNSDIPNSYRDFTSANPKMGMRVWESQTSDDPLVASSYNYPPAKQTVGETVNYMTSSRSNILLETEIQGLIAGSCDQAHSVVEQVMGAVSIEGRYSSAVIEQLTRQLRLIATKIIESTKSEIDSLADQEQLTELLTGEITQIISGVLNDGFAEISGRVVVRPEAHVSDIFGNVRRSE